MERPNAWKAYDEAAVAELEQLCGDYRAFISENKTERECVVSSVKLAEAAGYTNLNTAIAALYADGPIIGDPDLLDLRTKD